MSRDMEYLRQLSTESLDRLLQDEVRQDSPDGETVRRILRLLKERDARESDRTDRHIYAAWEKYRSEGNLPAPKLKQGRSWLIRIAAAAAVLCLVLLAAPQDAEAESFIGLLTRWTGSIFEFFDPKDLHPNQMDYEFRTDHPGLQQVYDAVVGMGVTDPVVPMWIPEEFELIDQEFAETKRKKYAVFTFASEKESLVIQIDLYDDEVPRTYHKDETFVGTYEKMGKVHTILRNNDSFVAIWNAESKECFLTTDCREDEFYRILASIYETEGE